MPTNIKQFKENLFSRRQLLNMTGLGVLGAGAILLFSKKLASGKIKSSYRGSNAKMGHLLRGESKSHLLSEGDLEVRETISIDTLIVGAGIAGLSAGWWLQRNSKNDFLIIELENQVGGNSKHGENRVSKYPWAAHYIPLPSKETKYVHLLFEEMGIIKGFENNLPVYDEYALCADPHERLFFQGRWGEGLLPQVGISEEDKNEYQKFNALVTKFKYAKGNDGKFAFNIPLALSSKDNEFLKLDKITFKDFIQSHGFKAKNLLWYLNYCCRDDYGQGYAEVSAWAGLHYFCARRAEAANADNQTVLTWPEGNGYIVNYLKDKMQNKLSTERVALNIRTHAKGVEIDTYDARNKCFIKYHAQNVIYSAPRYTAKRAISNLPMNALVEGMNYSPWLVANLTLKNRPKGEGAPLAWDNVSYYSSSLGYIFANHQDLKFNQQECVITYYLPLDQESPQQQRERIKDRTLDEWTDLLVADLEGMHPGVSQDIIEVEVWLWGHGMISPGVDYLWNNRLKLIDVIEDKIFFAHSDMSGISIFEEAQYQGVQAAQKILNKG